MKRKKYLLGNTNMRDGVLGEGTQNSCLVESSFVESVCRNDSMETVVSSSLLQFMYFNDIVECFIFCGFHLFQCNKNDFVTLLSAMDFHHSIIWSGLNVQSTCRLWKNGGLHQYIHEERSLIRYDFII